MEPAKAQYWMREALLEARKAEAEAEVPIGAVILLDEKIIGRGHNSSIIRNDPSAHAEIVALRHACGNMSNYRLPGSILVVTIEPCIMCLGAMIQARIETLVYGAPDPKAGAVHSCFEFAESPRLNHRIRVEHGILENECGELLKNFFQARRH